MSRDSLPLSVADMTDEQIVMSANELATLYLSTMGFVAPKGTRFYGSLNTRLQHAWNLAALAYEHIAQTDINDAAIDYYDDQVREPEQPLSKPKSNREKGINRP